MKEKFKMKTDYGKAARIREYSKFQIVRHIIVDDRKMTEEQKDQFVKNINIKLDYLIQDINAHVIGRTLPFVKVIRVFRSEETLRIIINNFDNTKSLDEYDILEPEKISLLINFRDLEPQRIITVSDDLIPGDAKMLIDGRSQIAAAVDIFLDIAMFHSYSFLDELSIKDKKEFNKIKFEFFMNNKLDSFYVIDDKNLPDFLSFAFAARIDVNKFSVENYCDIWNEFIKQYFFSEKHLMISPEKQVALHSDKGMIDNRYFDACYWEKKSKGDYLLLRINRGPTTNKEKVEIANYFSVPKFHCGPIKVVPISEYNKPFVKKWIREYYISAFKIVVS